MTRVETALEQVRLLMAIEAEQETPSTVAVTSVERVKELKQLVEELTTQVANLVQQRTALLTPRPPTSSLQHCFYCQ